MTTQGTGRFVNLEPDLNGYKNILRELERVESPTKEQQETIKELKAYINSVDTN